jgi:hypothetical protein
VEDNQRPNVSIISHSRERQQQQQQQPYIRSKQQNRNKREKGKNVWLIGDSSLLAVKRYAILGSAG